MSDFKLDSDHDLDLTDFEFSLIDSTDELTQRLLIELRTYKGELFWNTDFGTPYHQDILGKGNDLAIIESAFKAIINGNSGVKKLLEFGLDYTASTRSLQVTFKAQLYDDSELVVDEVI